jgi:hypothetical protein
MRRMIEILSAFVFGVLVIFYACLNNANDQFNLTGTWMSFVYNSAGKNQGAFISETSVIQTDSSHVTMKFSPDGKDSLTISGAVENSQMTGTFPGDSGCGAMPFSFTIDNSGNKMSGTISPVGSCEGAFVNAFKEIAPSVNVSGNWSLTASGSDGTHNGTMTLSQTASTVTGMIISGDSNTVSGFVFGDVFLATLTGIGTNHCNHVFFGTASGNSITGEYSFVSSKGQSSGGGCTDYGIFTCVKQ